MSMPYSRTRAVSISLRRPSILVRIFGIDAFSIVRLKKSFTATKSISTRVGAASSTSVEDISLSLLLLYSIVVVIWLLFDCCLLVVCLLIECYFKELLVIRFGLSGFGCQMSTWLSRAASSPSSIVHCPFPLVWRCKSTTNIWILQMILRIYARNMQNYMNISLLTRISIISQ